MANEISLSGSLSVFKPSVMTQTIGMSFNGLVFTMSGLYYVGPSTFQVSHTAATAVPLGRVALPHQSAWYNTDATNYVTLFNGASGAVFARLLAGECAFIPLDPTCVPYALANAADVVLEYCIFSS